MSRNVEFCRVRCRGGTYDRISPEIWTFQHNRWLTGGTCCFGLGRAPQNVGLNFHENLKIVKKFWKFAPKLIRGCWIRIWKPFFIKLFRWPVLRWSCWVSNNTFWSAEYTAGRWQTSFHRRSYSINRLYHHTIGKVHTIFPSCSIRGGTFSPFSGPKTIAMTSSMTSSTNVTKISKNPATIFW